jgi:UDP-N-acetylglucosamine acyltransferase
MIHPTAIVHPDAQLGPGVEVGPYAVIDAGVRLGARCRVGPQVYLTGLTTIGEGNVFHAGCVIGDAPQDLKYRGAPTRVRIGDGNVFREHVTVHRSTTDEGETVIGSRCFLMAGSHVAHNCRLADEVIMANGSVLGGHATVDERAFISGNCCVHQFTRVGALAMMQGGCCVSRDVPPFCIAHQINLACGLNTVGLRRAGITSAERLELRQLYHLMFRQGGTLAERIAGARSRFTSAPALQFLQFAETAKRGLIAEERAGRHGAMPAD